MKGVVLAGGLGTRLAPMTRVVNKHLLDVFDEPMIHFPIRSLAQAGVTYIVIVTGEEIAFAAQGHGARLLLKKVSLDDARRFGVATVDVGRITSIDENPAEPKNDLVQTGCYMYDGSVFEVIDAQEPSARGELEITDANMEYVRRGQLQFDVIPGWWTDAGTPASKLKASILVALAKGVVFQP